MNFCKYESHAGYCNKKGNRLCTLGCKEAEMIEVEPVIRCGDCAIPHNKWTGCPKLNGTIVMPSDFCSYGERADNDTNNIKERQDIMPNSDAIPAGGH